MYNIVHLQDQCSNPECQGCEFYKDEIDGYICINCGTVINRGVMMEVEYGTFGIPLARGKMKSKAFGNDSDEDEPDDNSEFQFDTGVNFGENDSLLNVSTTNINSRRKNSEALSTFSGISRKIKIIKTPTEILEDAQKNFENIYKIILDDFFNLNINFKNYKNIKKDIKKSLNTIAKQLWESFLAKEFIIQKYLNIKSLEKDRGKEEGYHKKKKRHRSRSRENSIDESDDNHNKNIRIKIKTKKQKTLKLHEQTKMRQVNERKVYKLYKKDKEKSQVLLSFQSGVSTNLSFSYSSLSNNKISKKKLMKKFIEEYDEVLNFIKNDKCFEIIPETERENINITNIINFEQIVQIINELGLLNNETETYIKECDFESLIHSIFILQGLHYKTLHENNDITKAITSINSNEFLFIIFQIYHLNDLPLLLNEILFSYKNIFYINRSSLDEINLLFLYNFQKFKNSINQFEKLFNINILIKKAESIIDRLCANFFKMPIEFNILCKYILHLIKDKINLILNKKYIIEYICLGIIFFSLKVIYGLNDLPYLCQLLNNVSKGYFKYEDDIDLTEQMNLFKKNTSKDNLCNFFTSIPSELDLTSLIINEIKLREQNSIVLSPEENKINYFKEYKDKYYDIYLNNFLIKTNKEQINYSRNIENNDKEIDSLEKKYKENKKKNNKKHKKNKWTVKKSENFTKSLDLIENPLQKFNPFLQEEINFHESINKSKEKNVDFPLPPDTYIRMKRNAKNILLNYHRPSEMIFIFLFCNFFRIDYLSLRRITRLIEYYIEKII